jgi:hypothetical protein
MIEITNRTKFPVQIIVRSGRDSRKFTTKNIPSVGKGKNVFYLEDERRTEYIDRLEKMKLISTKYIPDTEINKKGE